MIDSNGQAAREHEPDINKDIERDAGVEPGFKMTELGLLPEDWDVVKLGEVADRIFGGGTPSTKRNDYWDGSIPWTTTAIIKEDDIYLRSYQRCITEQGLNSSSAKIVPKGSILIGSRVGVGKAVVTTLDIAINQDITAVITKGDLLPEFLALSLKAPIMQKWFEDRKRGSTIKGVPRADILLLELPLPPRIEQQGIVHALDVVHKGIEETGKVVDAARELKKSLMRHLFTYGPVPFNQADQVPLKETEIGFMPEHWTISQIGNVIKRAQYGLSKRNQERGMYPILGMNNLGNGLVRINGLKYIDLNKAEFQKFSLNKGDVLFNRTNSYELVGKTSLFDLGGDFVFASYLVRIEVDSVFLTPEFLNYYLNANFVQTRLKLLATRGVSQSNISATKLKSFTIPLPPPPEQQEIARILQAVDKKIEAEENRKRALEVQFKTLLHYLMTGKIRVKDVVEVKHEAR